MNSHGHNAVTVTVLLCAVTVVALVFVGIAGGENAGGSVAGILQVVTPTLASTLALIRATETKHTIEQRATDVEHTIAENADRTTHEVKHAIGNALDKRAVVATDDLPPSLGGNT